VKTYSVQLDTTELEAITKTIGIALDNLSNKIAKHGKDSPIGRSATADRLALLSAQGEILVALGEAYDV
jgi:hypothetical protein